MYTLKIKTSTGTYTTQVAAAHLLHALTWFSTHARLVCVSAL